VATVLKGGRLVVVGRIVVILSAGTVDKMVTGTMGSVFSVGDSSSVISGLGDSTDGTIVLMTLAVAVILADVVVVGVLLIVVTVVGAAWTVVVVVIVVVVEVVVLVDDDVVSSVVVVCEIVSRCDVWHEKRVVSYVQKRTKEIGTIENNATGFHSRTSHYAIYTARFVM
jgi:hypothetical protein